MPPCKQEKAIKSLEELDETITKILLREEKCLQKIPPWDWFPELESAEATLNYWIHVRKCRNLTNLPTKHIYITYRLYWNTLTMYINKILNEQLEPN